ncbi:Aspartate-semialdehyde dehydrogenase 2 [Candidatus Cyrtobacter comes]|uniref:Aspartate-semialdehyde dehydrogenase n=1 Tax=Candidatus Cyrtobacter comes TaxID=675776 RepID=A0ABU5L7S1_9RICK|nr:aspartate-semialdehyde dehydrogenase [Candidatus Cyrtobacter comes]MDZ5762177.1 Aspartate-semialdehyde dehydrogenase 2 [Candidatus Cyrtobacter comes]
MSYKVAVVGATGSVGLNMLQIMHERSFPILEVIPLSSENSRGREVSFGDIDLKVIALDDYDFSDTHIALFSAGSKVSDQYGRMAAEAGCIVIDNSSFFRHDDQIPLVVPEINGNRVSDYTKKNVIANPNCTTIQIVMALKPLLSLANIKKVIVTTFQSVSGAGKEGVRELDKQMRGMLFNKEPENTIFPRQIAHNAIPCIGSINKNGFSIEEEKIMSEVNKILETQIYIEATCVRVPIFVGHCASVYVEFEEEVDLGEALEVLNEFPGIMLSENVLEYVTPIDCQGEDAVFVSRIRQHSKNTLNMWVVSDNLRKGAALNAVQIAEELVEHHI